MASHSEIESRLIEFNRELWEEYMLHHNTAPYQRLALPEYLFLADIGLVETKEQVIATVGNLKIEALSIVHEEFRLHGQTAVLMGRLEVEGEVLGIRLPPVMRYLSVFVLSKEQEWKVLAQSLTRVIDPRQAETGSLGG
jgi:hypothetical protein